MSRAWHINYKGWRIRHDPLGKLACYYTESNLWEWCYFGDTLADIKQEIDRRMYVSPDEQKFLDEYNQEV